ncbi:Factor arrest protein 11 [Microbotryomycetes sp. JL221]|nr:Factor arrest protein 11 [Microbotryomycetes sp. JL221]
MSSSTGEDPATDVPASITHTSPSPMHVQPRHDDDHDDDDHDDNTSQHSQQHDDNDDDDDNNNNKEGRPPLTKPSVHIRAQTNPNRRDAIIDMTEPVHQTSSPEPIHPTTTVAADNNTPLNPATTRLNNPPQHVSNKSVFTFPSPPPDTNDIMSELEEFYSYVEVPQVIDHKQSFVQQWSHPQPFAESDPQTRLDHVHMLLDTLTNPDSQTRFQNARHLLYIAQGAFEQSTSPEHHLHLILTNATLLRQAGALQSLWQALKQTGIRWEQVSTSQTMTNTTTQNSNLGGDSHDAAPTSPQTAFERQECLDEINGEMALYLAVLYIMVEAHRGEQEWGQELMKLDPPMPIHLLNLVAGLRERNAKGYPVKKLLLLLWKSILSCIGGMKDISRVKKLVREIEGLPSDDDRIKRSNNKPETKVAPTDMQSFRNEIVSKYPSYQAPQIPLIQDLERIAAAAAPLPVKPTFSSRINPNHDPNSVYNYSVSGVGSGTTIGTTNGGVGQHPFQPGTPAPSPPPSPATQSTTGTGIITGVGATTGTGVPPPKPKKQQFQTDQSKPFVLPFAPSNAAPKGTQPRSVPKSIAEAGQLYQQNIRISTELWQTFKLREEYIADETGILKAALLNDLQQGKIQFDQQQQQQQQQQHHQQQGFDDDKRNKQSMFLHGQSVSSSQDAAKLSRRMEELVIVDSSSEEEGEDENQQDHQNSTNHSSDKEEEEEDDEQDNLMDPLSMLKHLKKQIKKQERNETNQNLKKKLNQKRMDVEKLQRIEQLYRAVLPNLQSAVIVLLKLLLATVTANSNNANSNNGGGPPDSGNDEPIELTLEDVDINRHREITSKAVSAILILLLKWFKTSHVMKFHYLSQLLVDSNCLLLILKMFGLQEVSTSVKTKHDRPEMNFFKYCHTHVNPSSLNETRPEDVMFESHSQYSTSPNRQLVTEQTTSGLGIEGAQTLSPPPQQQQQTRPIGTSVANIVNGVGSGADEDQVELVTDFNWRNFFSIINFIHILQKLTKKKIHRILLLVQYKSSAILKRILKVSHPTLQLYVLKVIKSQVPYCGRKWRQTNMKVITAIYLHCRPDLRDEWLTGIDVDNDVEESLPHEQALRQLVRFFNTKHYGTFAPLLHRRASSSSSLNQQQQQHHGGTNGRGSHEFGYVTSSQNSSGFEVGGISPGTNATSVGEEGSRRSSSGSSSNGEDMFPPNRSVNSFDIESSFRQSAILPTWHDSTTTTTTTGTKTSFDTTTAVGGGGSLGEEDLFGSDCYEIDDLLLYPRGGLQGAMEGSVDWFEHAHQDWQRLSDIVGEYSDVSDSESVGSLNDLLNDQQGAYGRATHNRHHDEDDVSSEDGNVSEFDIDESIEDSERRARHEWQHISPETISALEEEKKAGSAPNSPSPRLSRRRSSTGPPVSPALRPVLIDRDDDQVGEFNDEQVREGPMPSEPHSGPAVDEVELVFGE